MGGSAVCDAALHPERLPGLFLLIPGIRSRFQRKQKREYISALESDAYAVVMETYFEEILAGSTPGVRKKIMGKSGTCPRKWLCR